MRPFSLDKGYINLYIWYPYDVHILLIMGGGCCMLNGGTYTDYNNLPARGSQ